MPHHYRSLHYMILMAYVAIQIALLPLSVSINVSKVSDSTTCNVVESSWHWKSLSYIEEGFELFFFLPTSWPCCFSALVLSAVKSGHSTFPSFLLTPTTCLAQQLCIHHTSHSRSRFVFICSPLNNLCNGN